jgi:5'-nucleotidase
MSKPHVLVTNDDGIDSVFLQYLVEALESDFRVSVAAPATEQSWIGRAMSRHSEVRVEANAGLFSDDVQAWAISGTPSDCVNIALGHLIKEPVDMVLSGINIGFNTTDTLILSSGTVAGAIEGALWELPAIAFSQCVPKTIFAEISERKGEGSPEYAELIRASAEHARRIALAHLGEPSAPGTVLNVNFPAHTNKDTPIENTLPAKIRLGSLFHEVSPGAYRFRYTDGSFREDNAQSDRAALERGSISLSLLDMSKIGLNPDKWSHSK